MKNKEIEELLNDMSKVYEAHVKIIDKYNNADEIHYASPISLKQIKLLLSHIEQLEKRNKQLYEGFMATQEELTDYATKNEQLENNRDKAIEVINTQLKNAEGGTKDNLRIIKFNLIKGSCTFEDLKTEEDYKYILKGDSE